jgi:predicted lipoprotein with Yx(FWY)xxD motif
MKRSLLTLLAATALLGAFPGAALAHHKKPRRAKLELRQTSAGMILVGRSGYTLYAFSKDKPRKDACIKIPGCLGAWPAVTTVGKPIAGPGIQRSLIGTIKLGKKTQVTYAGFPLYTYRGDSKPAETTNINIFQFEGYWPALAANGQEIA